MKLDSSNLNFPTITHGFFTREGGVSEGIYESMNCAFGSQDDRDKVLENRARIANVMRLTTTRHLVTLAQVHSNTVHQITSMEDLDRIKGAEGDGLVTNQRGVALGILTADCAPVLFADPSAGIVGAAHAGWKGAVAGIIRNTVESMRQLGARDIHAAIGPCIAQVSYEVDRAFYTRFLEEDENFQRFFKKGNDADHWQFDLKEFTRHRLLKAKVASTNILPDDTYLDKRRFFSYRRATHKNEPDYGRQISCICLV